MFLAQFGVAFSLSSIVVILPFYIYSISAYSPVKTLLWTGVIVSASNIGAAIFSPVWGKLSSKVNPKTLYLRGIMSHAIVLLIMAFTKNLTSLLILRFLQGIMGGISTIGLIIIKTSTPGSRISQEIGKFQSSIILGQLFGPAAGAFLAYKLSFFPAFIFSSMIMVITLIFTNFFLEEGGKDIKPKITDNKIRLNYFDLWFLSLSATIHAVYLPAILPDILKSFNFDGEKAIMVAGMIVLIYGISSFLGVYILPSLSSKNKTIHLITLFALLSSFFQIMHIFACTAVMFTILRVLQTFFVAAIMPLCLGIVAKKYSGTEIGILNTARFSGNALAPLISTFILYSSGQRNVYLFLSVLILLPLTFIRGKNSLP